MEKRRIWCSFVISLLFHIALVLFFLFGPWKKTADDQARKPILVEILPPQKSSNKNQIVESNSGRKAEEAAPNAYLGAETRVVDQESIKRERSRVQPAAQPMRPRLPESAQEIVDAEKPLSKFGLPIDVHPEKSAHRNNEPEWRDFSDQFGDTYPDYVKGVKESETTALNTKEFVFFGYYKRIRDQLDQAWRPILKENIYRYLRKGRNISSDVEHITKTMVTLDRKGEIVKVQVIEESGIVDLDDAAIRAFNKAGPFPNPPNGIIDERGEIKIQWNFILRS